MLFDTLKYVRSENVFKTQMLKKIPSDKTNGIKNTLIFSFGSSNSSQFYFQFVILI